MKCNPRVGMCREEARCHRPSKLELSTGSTSHNFTYLALEMFPSNILDVERNKLDLEVSLTAPLMEEKYPRHYVIALRDCYRCDAFIELNGVDNIEMTPPTDAPTGTPTDTLTLSPVHVHLCLAMTLEGVGMLGYD